MQIELLYWCVEEHSVSTTHLICLKLLFFTNNGSNPQFLTAVRNIFTSFLSFLIYPPPPFSAFNISLVSSAQLPHGLVGYLVATKDRYFSQELQD